MWPFLSQTDDNDIPTSPKPKPAKTEEISQTGKEMWDLLKARKGLVVIGKFFLAFLITTSVKKVY